MSWRAYKLVFRLDSPLHIGHFKIGNIQRTRYYIPGITFCGALTATITRMNNSADYAGIEKRVNKFFAFSYFYLTIQSDGTEPLYPCFTENRYQFGKAKMAAEEFEYEHISSYASTALDYSLQVAEEGSLHDVEYICPKTKLCGKQVYLTGFIFVNNEALPQRLQSWRNALKRLQLGGERTYGFGRLSLMDDIKIDDTKEFFDGWEKHLNNDRPVVKVKDKKPLLAHTLIDDSVTESGIVEVFVGRRTTKSDEFGVEVSEAKICLAPGTNESKVDLKCHGTF